MLLYEEKSTLPTELRLLIRDFKIGRFSWVSWVDKAGDGKEVRDLKHKKPCWPLNIKETETSFLQTQGAANNLNKAESALSLRASR